jgi:small ligand-binding sensory domain FIST
VAYSALPDTQDAVAQVLADLRGEGGCAVAIVFATPHHSEGVRALLSRLRLGLGTKVLFGGSTTSVISPAGEHEEDGAPGLGVLALWGVEARTSLATSAPEAEAFFAEATPEGLVLALPDPRRLDPGLLGALLKPRPGGRLVGAGVGGSDEGFFGLCGVDAGEGLCPLLQLSGVRVSVGVTQGVQPATAFAPVTRARRQALLEIGGEKAIEVFSAFVQAQKWGGTEPLPSALFVALRGRDGEEAWTRPIVGVDPHRGALLVQGEVLEGQQVAFALRETLGALRDRQRMLAALQAESPRPQALLYFNCVGRGQSLHLEPDADLKAIHAAFPGVPLLGMAAAFELGPREGRPWLHMYSGVLVALSDPS